MKQHGKQMRETILLPAGLHQKLKAEAKNTSTALCEVVRSAIESELASRDKARAKIKAAGLEIPGYDESN